MKNLNCVAKMCKDVKLSCQEKDDFFNRDPNQFKKEFPHLTFLIRNTDKMNLEGDNEVILTPQEYIDYILDTTREAP